LDVSIRRWDAHSAYVLTKTAQQVTLALFEKDLQPSLRNRMRRYAPIHDGGGVHFSTLSQYVGIHMGDMAPTQQGFSSAFVAGDQPNASHINALFEGVFGGANNVLCAQALHLLPDAEFRAFCQAMTQKWCPSWQTPQLCTKFLGYCSARKGCDASKSTSLPPIS